MARLPSPIEKIDDPLFRDKGIQAFIKRDDLIHPYIMGNKWRKLKYNLQYAKEAGFKGILTFGGAFSNHIAATAAACNEHGLKSVGIIRGDELNPSSNVTLRFASKQGMDLQFVSRKAFREMRGNLADHQRSHADYYVLPEGGTNELAIKGCAEIIMELREFYDYVITPVGTGGTMAGLLKGMEGKGEVIGISAIKGEFVKADFEALTKKYKISSDNYQIFSDFHFGGYGRVNDDLIRFINRTRQNIGLLFDPIYTAKMYFAVRELTKRNFFVSGTKILILHTGGLQGIDGYNEFHEKKILI